ncbi:MAG TPA: PEP-CTERM sorting domain-containing protein [Myxococcota bacterium]|nr:PEP-CTERM sorting domain-containing protein [Myxococcota bacterium]
MSKRFLLAGLACAASIFGSAPALATLISGTMQLAGNLTVGPTFLNFCNTAGPCPVAPGNWNPPGIGTGDLSTPYADDPNGGLLANLNNVNAPVGTLLPGNGILFLTFAPSGALPVPDIQFFLTELFAGVGGTASCGAAPAPGQTCTPAGSALTFLNSPGDNSSATISAVGLARRNSTDEFDSLQMVFTTQFNAPFQSVLASLASAGSVTSTYSVSFAATVPEPSTTLLLSVGIVGLAVRRRRARGVSLG